MPLKRQPIVSMLNGVSQQPASMRHPTQGELQENALASLANGLEKRPPSHWVAKIIGTPIPTEDVFYHNINRSSTERYTVSVESGDIRVYDMAGVEKTINFAEFRFYHQDDATATGNGKSRRIFIPPGITTVELNTSGITTATVVWEKSATGAFAGEETTVRTDTVDTTGTVSWTSGEYLRARISAYTSGTIDAYSDYADASYLQATDPRGTFRAISIADYTFLINNTIVCAMDDVTNAESLTGTVQIFSDLPASPSDGNIYKVVGDGSTDFDDYYVKYVGADAVWIEYLKPGLKNAFDNATLPHTLIAETDGTFTFSNGNFDARAVGDDADVNPDPPFIGDTINELYFHRDRLGVTSDESVSMSRSGQAPGGYFSYWVQTATAVLDSDPVFLNSPHVRNSKFHAAVPFSETLLLFSPDAQFVLNADGVLAPDTARIDMTTEFSASSSARPVAVGQNLYFPVDSGDYTGVREYFVETEIATKDAINITAHIPRYIPSDIYHMTGSTNADMLLLLSDKNATEKRRIYVYKFYWDDQEKLQSSWSYWEWPADNEIVHAEILDNIIYVYFKRADGVHLERITLDSDTTQSDFVRVHLDHRQGLVGTYTPSTNKTRWTLPYDRGTMSPVIVTAPGSTLEDGMNQMDISSAAGASTPDHADNSITGDLTIYAYIQPDSWTPGVAQTLVAKWTGPSQKSYKLNLNAAGRLQLHWSDDGSTERTAGTSTVPTGLLDRRPYWVGAYLDVSTGDVFYYTRAPGTTTWVQLGNKVTLSATSIFNSTSIVYVGDNNGVGTFKGKIFQVDLYALAPSIAVLKQTFNADGQVGNSSWVSSTGETWTLIGTAEVRAQTTAGIKPSVTYPSSTVIEATGDYGNQWVWMGVDYTKRWRFSEFFNRDREGKSNIGGRLQLRRMHVRCVDTGFFKAEVTPAERPTATYTYTHRLGDATFILGQVVLSTGTFAFPTLGSSKRITIDLVNDTWMPSSWLSAEHIGLYSPRTVIQ